MNLNISDRRIRVLVSLAHDHLSSDIVCAGGVYNQHESSSTYVGATWRIISGTFIFPFQFTAHPLPLFAYGVELSTPLRDQ